MEEKDIEQPITQTNSYASRLDTMKEKLSVLALLEHIMVVGEITKLTEREKSLWRNDIDFETCRMTSCPGGKYWRYRKWVLK